jgi:DNA-binding response OmpR family regulator
VFAAEGRLRVLLLDEGVEVPEIDDVVEDWIRVPVDDADVQARVDGLRRRAAVLRAEQPDLDPDGLLRYRGEWASLPPVEARLMRPLIDRFGAVVGRDQLAEAGWPNGAPGRNALDVHVLRVRRRIASVGLVIRTVRSRGYLLEAEVSAAAAGRRSTHDTR